MGRAGYNGGGGGGGWARHPKEGGTFHEKHAKRGPLAGLGEGAQKYLSLIQQYGSRRNQGRDAQYNFLAEALVRQGAEAELACRTSLVEFFDDRAQHEEFKSATDLEAHLDPAGRDKSRRRRLYIVEDLSVKTICLLGAYLKIHPSIFAFHYSIEEGSAHCRSVAAFPSIDHVNTTNGLDYASSAGEADPANQQKRSFALRYPIIMPRLSAAHNPDPNLCPPWLKPDKRLADQSAYAKFNIERSLHTPTLNDEWDTDGMVATMANQVSYWSRNTDDGGWIALILVDPCIKDPKFLEMLRGAPSPNLHRLLQYADIDEKLDIPKVSSDWKPPAKFSKFILYEDLIHHLAIGGCEPGSTSIAVTPFIRGFAINHWMVFLNHVHSCTGSIRSKLFADGFQETTNGWQYRAKWGGQMSEWVLDRVQAWKIDLALSLTEVESNMRALRIDPEDICSFGVVGKREAQMWRYIKNMIERHRDIFMDISNS
ncbi:MAG: hypothetical protein M1821_004493 [Bathelium mastoideum]|nr:MAG: hypothetical protein M1821_004493 [Bathelium mastoideum]